MGTSCPHPRPEIGKSSPSLRALSPSHPIPAGFLAIPAQQNHILRNNVFANYNFKKSVFNLTPISVLYVIFVLSNI